MNSLRKNIVDITEEIISQTGYFLIDIIIRGTEKDRVFEIFIDGENYITAKECAELSRNIYRAIEEQSTIKFSYRLDVSSPGIDRPLLFLRQFPKHINRKFEIIYKSDEKKKKLKATLKKVAGEQLTFLTDKELTINFSDIIKAKVVISFS
jgi:ribosome maturation factor RimP